ncbi:MULTISPECIES: amino-acid N-acetyltransferase [Kocuria]|uniref:Amino-acid N-acetyltransferase n=1 Tax=Kocuria oceani TaxID=988827 RepID=A0ABV9TPU9_9MICC|nr:MULTISPECIES: amino-acid N-acetyltransferase [Kocuria]KLU08050.1 N-acetylglutamate synthase [Kocuria sp. SM24M-10]OLT08665.1 N-acetylglutamate synthase [Kocuria sp. CNJ-770]
MTELRLRPARTSDVPAIKELVAPLARAGVLINKDTVAYYEGIQEFLVAEDAGTPGRLVGCGALHVMWEDLGEVRTLATSDAWRGRGVGRALLAGLIERARAVGVSRVFCLTFEVDFFRRYGFEVMPNQQQLDPDVFAELMRSHDEGVAEYLDLARVKPNTLGNTRMILELSPEG